MTTIQRGIGQPAVTTVVPAKTPTVQLNSKDPQFDNALQRFQSGVTDTLDSVLGWLNDHFALPPTIRDPVKRTVVPDTSTLVGADIQAVLSGTCPVVFTIATSAITAGATNTVFTLPLPVGTLLTGIYVSAGTPTAGSAYVSVQNASVAIKGNTGTNFLAPVLLAAPQPVTVTASSAWAIAAGTIYVTLYLAQSA